MSARRDFVLSLSLSYPPPRDLHPTGNSFVTLRCVRSLARSIVGYNFNEVVLLFPPPLFLLFTEWVINQSFSNWSSSKELVEDLRPLLLDR